MNKPLKNATVFSILVCIGALNLSFVWDKPMPASTEVVTVPAANNVGELAHAAAMYDSLQLGLAGLNRDAFDNALKGWDKLKQEGKLENDAVIAIADFSQSSNKKRLYVLDVENYKVLFNTLVAHGRNSGREWATQFSNRLSSFQSSPGFYVTGNTYFGSNGYSLKLNGMEKGINDKALKRAIVMHGADYVNESYITSQGFIGRSLGCPAVPARQAKSIINTLKGGTCLYIHVPNQGYLSRSPILSDSSMG
jgi:hypothetical protein